MENIGYIKLYRKIFDNPIFTDKPDSWFKIWIYILGNVNHSDKGLNPGTGFFKYKKMALVCNCSDNVIEKCIIFLKKSEMIATQKATNGIMIEVANWSEYQQSENQPKATQKATSKATTERHKSDNLYNKNERMKEDIIDKSIIIKEDFDIKPEDTEDDILKKKVGLFFLMRKNMKKPLREESIGTWQKKLEKLSCGRKDLAIKILDESIANGWQGIFPLKNTQNTPMTPKKQEFVMVGADF